MKKLEKWQSKVNNLISNNYFIAGVLLLTVYLIFNLGYVINEKFLSTKTPSTTKEQINLNPDLKPVTQQDLTQTEPSNQTPSKSASPTTSTPTKTPSSIAADQASAAAKELARCIEYERGAWQTFQIRYQQAIDYKNMRSSEYLSAYQNQLISLAEYDDLMTKTYDLANDKTKQAYQMYYDDVIGQRCTNVKAMPQLYYWNS